MRWKMNMLTIQGQRIVRRGSTIPRRTLPIHCNLLGKSVDVGLLSHLLSHQLPVLLVLLIELLLRLLLSIAFLLQCLATPTQD